MTQPDRQPLDYASPPPPRDASSTRIFRYLLPSGIFLATLVGTWFIENTYPGGDSRDFQGPCCMIVFAPIALIYGISAIIEATRPKGLSIFLRAIGWCFVLPLGTWLSMWLIVKLQLFKHL